MQFFFFFLRFFFLQTASNCFSSEYTKPLTCNLRRFSTWRWRFSYELYKLVSVRSLKKLVSNLSSELSIYLLVSSFAHDSASTFRLLLSPSLSQRCVTIAPLPSVSLFHASSSLASGVVVASIHPLHFDGSFLRSIALVCGFDLVKSSSWIRLDLKSCNFLLWEIMFFPFHDFSSSIFAAWLTRGGFIHVHCTLFSIVEFFFFFIIIISLFSSKLFWISLLFFVDLCYPFSLIQELYICRFLYIF